MKYRCESALEEVMTGDKKLLFPCSYLVQKLFKFLLHNSHDFFMFYGYHITINRNTSDTDAAYKIFFIILGLISDYQLSSLFQIIILLKKSTRRGAFFHVCCKAFILQNSGRLV